MKMMSDFGQKEQFPPGPSIKLPIFFGVQTSSYVPGYVIQSKDLRKIHKAALLGDVATVQHLLLRRSERRPEGKGKKGVPIS